jgi:hypothetical protein
MYFTGGNILYSEGQDVLTTQQGEMATYTQQATGQITPESKVGTLRTANSF